MLMAERNVGLMKRAVLGDKPHRAQSLNARNVIAGIIGTTATFLPLIPSPLAIAQEISDTEGSRTEFTATVVNSTAQPQAKPPGMVWIPGGEFSMGAVINGHGSCEMPMASNDSGPIHRVRVDGFWMDATAVTNEEFEKFVKATERGIPNRA